MTESDSKFKKTLKVLTDKDKRVLNIAAATLFMCFAFLVIVYIWPPGNEKDISFGQIYTGVLNLMGIIIGWMFGRDKS